MCWVAVVEEDCCWMNIQRIFTSRRGRTLTHKRDEDPRNEVFKLNFLFVHVIIAIGSYIIPTPINKAIYY
jgi:hypothetical protein